MGNRGSRYPECKTTILMEGLDEAGKTSLIFKLKYGKAVSTANSSRLIFNVNGLTLKFLDIYGRSKARPAFYFQNGFSIQGIIYVIDSADRERLDEALDELVKHVLLAEDTSGTVVMVLGNKQDIRGAMSALEIQEALEQKYKFSSTSAFAHTVFVRPCSVLTMEGVKEAFREFVEQLNLLHDGNAQAGLLPLVNKETGENPDETNPDKFDAKDAKESLARAKVKRFLKNPFCLFKSVD